MAESFTCHFQGFKLNAFKSNKVVEITMGRVQGLRENVEHFRNSAVMRQDLANEYKPLLFNTLTQEEIPFPEPDGPLPEIKLRPAKQDEPPPPPPTYRKSRKSKSKADGLKIR